MPDERPKGADEQGEEEGDAEGEEERAEVIEPTRTGVQEEVTMP